MTAYHRNNPANGASTPSAHDKAGFMQCHDGGTENLACAPEVHCGDCHEHNNSFVGVNDNVPCENCHDSIRGARPIITTQFDKLSTHIPGGSADAVKANCVVCHGDHTHDGSVYGFDADDGTTKWGTAAADTLATGVGEIFEPHCLSCHDDGSADSLPGPAGELTAGQTVESPFTNSAKPPVIGDAVWQGSSHDRPTANNPTGPLGPNPVSCVGGGTNGCHASGHGTDELNLLASIPTDSDISSKRSRQCTNCHKSGGVSSKDIKTAFQPDAAATEAIYQTQAASGHLANRRHDIFDTDQTYSSASGDGSTATSLACADCHNVHADNATSPVQNPDSGSPLQPYAPATWATADDVANNDVGEDPTFGATEPDMIEFCLACHDGAGGTQQAGSSQLPNGMYDMAATYVSDFHGANYGSTGGNGFLKPPFLVDTKYAPMQCTQCHGAHGSDNIFNLRSSITVGAGTPSETVMQTGGFGGKGDMGTKVYTTYDLRCATTTEDRLLDPDCDSGTQQNFQWGAWCSFCHNLEQHGLNESKSCNTGHRHGGGKM
jgi:hypothetical protein